MTTDNPTQSEMEPYKRKSDVENSAMIRTFKFRIYPTKRQEQALSDQLAICCELYNAALQERRDAWRIAGKSISYFDQSRELTEIKALREDVAAVNRNVLEDALKRVNRAFDGFFRRAKKGQAGYPRFRSARRYDSITFRQIGNALTSTRLRLSKVGNVRIKLHRVFEGDVKTLTIKREAGRWFAFFAVETNATPLPFNPNMVGVDVGLKAFAVLSNGSVIDNPHWLRRTEKKLRRLQRCVARRKRGSRRRAKAALLLQRFHNHIRDQRRDFHHKISRNLVDTNGLIAVEDLNISGLAAGILSKAIHDAGWGNFLRMLAYKAEEAGRVFVKVNPRGTSQICVCGAEVRKTLNERAHFCEACGLTGTRDHVSAQVILARSLPSGANVGELSPCVA